MLSPPSVHQVESGIHSCSHSTHPVSDEQASFSELLPSVLVVVGSADVGDSELESSPFDGPLAVGAVLEGPLLEGTEPLVPDVVDAATLVSPGPSVGLSVDRLGMFAASTNVMPASLTSHVAVSWQS
jgi:hypothetical protein